MSIKIDMLGGNCPVQGEGTIDGKPFYFRARSEHWTLSIGGVDLVMEPDWMVRVRYSNDTFGAGWMSEEEARRFIYIGANMYRTATFNAAVKAKEAA